MTLKEAIDRAENETGGTINSVVDCGDKWALSFAELENKYNEEYDDITRLLNSKTGSAHVLVSKNSDKFEYCSAYDYIQSIKFGVDVTFAS